MEVGRTTLRLKGEFIKKNKKKLKRKTFKVVLPSKIIFYETSSRAVSLLLLTGRKIF